MNNETRLNVSLYLRGNNLEPKTITDKTCILPNKSWKKGDKNGIYIPRKLGLWSVSSQLESDNISDHINNILEKFLNINYSLLSIHGVEEAYLDIFIAADYQYELELYFEIPRVQIEELNRLGLDVRTSYYISKKDI